jgi:preprotein translocase subunit SecB
MPESNMPVLLKKFFYPIQVVKALSNHDKSGPNDKTQTIFKRDIKKIPEEDGTYAVEIELSVDLEESINPPYDFNINCVGVFSVNQGNFNDKEIESLAYITGTQILIGAVRERLAMLTHSSPWGTFNVNVMAIPNDGNQQANGDSEVPNHVKTNNRPKKKVAKKK